MKRVIACIDSSPCIHAIAKAAAWVAHATGRELVLLHIVDYYPASHHLGEMSGVIGFESNAMLLKELADLEQKQSQLALEFSNNLLQHMRELLLQKYQIEASILQQKGDFLEQTLQLLQTDDVVILGRVGEHAAERNKPMGSNVENFIRGANCTVMTVGPEFKTPTRFLFAYEYSPTCQHLLQRICNSDLLKPLQCHLVYVGHLNDILNTPAQQLRDAGFKVETAYRYGDVAESILSYQHEHNLGLMVLGAFSHSKIHQLFLGSVATSIFRKATVPLLVAK